jgi:REP element-mobilizing transposase RayT
MARKHKPKQLGLFDEKPFRSGTKARVIQQGLGYGGAINYRKVKRPFSSKSCTHLILRSRLLQGARSLLKSNRQKWVADLLHKKAKKYQAKLYSFSINSNHLHLLMKFPTPELQAHFLRDLAGSLAIKIKKTFQLSETVRVWDGRPFSRLVKPKAFPSLAQYIQKNSNEASGLWAYSKRPMSALIRALTKFSINASPPLSHQTSQRKPSEYPASKEKSSKYRPPKA